MTFKGLEYHMYGLPMTDSQQGKPPNEGVGRVFQSKHKPIAL